MSMTDKLWDAFSTVIKMNDKVVSLAATTVAQQLKSASRVPRMITPDQDFGDR
jgi:hypothetical protein